MVLKGTETEVKQGRSELQELQRGFEAVRSPLKEISGESA